MLPQSRSSPERSHRLDGRFWTYASANAAAALGDGVRLAAMPLLAASLTRTPTLVAAVAASQSLPWLLVNPLSGVLVDRHDRRLLMQVAGVVRIVLVLAVIAGLWLQLLSIPWLCALGFLLGGSDTLGANAATGLLPKLIQGPQLERANAVSQGAYAVGSNLLGPALGAVLFTVARVAPFSADAASFGVAVLLLTRVRGAFRPAPGPASSLVSELTEGMTWLWRHRPLRVLALLVALSNLAYGLLSGVLVLFVLEVMRLRPVAYGLLLAVLAVGGLLASAVAVRLGRRLRRPGILRAVLAVNAVGMALIWALPTVLVVVPVFLVNGFLNTMWDVVVVSYRQREAPDRLLGRVTSAFRTVGIGAVPVGAALGGLLAQLSGLRAPFLVASLVLLVAFAISLPGLAGAGLSR